MPDDPSDDPIDDSSNDPLDDDLPAFPVDGSDVADVPNVPDVPDVPPERDPMDPEPRTFTDPDAIDDLPTVTCSRCDREWDLSYELDELAVGNRAVEQFAMDHERHTGHYPDGVTPWVATCRICPDGERFLAERPARRFATTHARHTGHPVELSKPDADVAETVRDPAGDDDPGDPDGPGEPGEPGGPADRDLD